MKTYIQFILMEDLLDHNFIVQYQFLNMFVFLIVGKHNYKYMDLWRQQVSH
jgi:hypothetical protein